MMVSKVCKCALHEKLTSEVTCGVNEQLREVLTQQNKLRTGEERERLNYFVGTFPLKYPEQMPWQMMFPRQLDVIP